MHVQENTACLDAAAAAFAALERTYGPLLSGVQASPPGTDGGDNPSGLDGAVTQPAKRAALAGGSCGRPGTGGEAAGGAAAVALCERVLAALPQTLDLRQASEVNTALQHHNLRPCSDRTRVAVGVALCRVYAALHQSGLPRTSTACCSWRARHGCCADHLPVAQQHGRQ